MLSPQQPVTLQVTRLSPALILRQPLHLPVSNDRLLEATIVGLQVRPQPGILVTAKASGLTVLVNRCRPMEHRLTSKSDTWLLSAACSFAWITHIISWNGWTLYDWVSQWEMSAVCRWMVLVWHNVSMLVSISVPYLHQVWLVLGWVTICIFSWHSNHLGTSCAFTSIFCSQLYHFSMQE